MSCYQPYLPDFCSSQIWTPSETRGGKNLVVRKILICDQKTVAFFFTAPSAPRPPNNKRGQKPGGGAKTWQIGLIGKPPNCFPAKLSQACVFEALRPRYSAQDQQKTRNAKVEWSKKTKDPGAASVGDFEKPFVQCSNVSGSIQIHSERDQSRTWKLPRLCHGSDACPALPRPSGSPGQAPQIFPKLVRIGTRNRNLKGPSTV